MSTWSGWQRQFLDAARVIVTQPNLDFLTQWAAHANSPSCRNNPVDLHSPVGASTNCVKPAGRDFWTQNYASHADAAQAFAHQTNAAAAGAILDTLGSGNPFQDPGYKQVGAALRVWASTNFADFYESEVGSSSGGGGGGGGGAPHAHGGWKAMRESFNHTMPKELHASQRSTDAALRALARARKVRL